MTDEHHHHWEERQPPHGPPPSWHMPVDEPILAAMPPEGSRLGYHVLGSTVKMIVDRMNEGVEKEAQMTTGIVAQRITRWLRPNGMVVEVKVHGAGGSKGYQITQAGQAMLAAIRGANQ